jgi:hypothetical protein
MKHLSPLDFQSLLEGGADSELLQHLAACKLCRSELSAELRAECALSELGRQIAGRELFGNHAPRRTPLHVVAAHDCTKSSAEEWDEVSLVRATTDVTELPQRSTTSKRRLRASRLRSALAHTLCAAAVALLPWVSFLSAPAPQAPTPLSLVQNSRCVVMQPWCR